MTALARMVDAQRPRPGITSGSGSPLRQRPMNSSRVSPSLKRRFSIAAARSAVCIFDQRAGDFGTCLSSTNVSRPLFDCRRYSTETAGPFGCHCPLIARPFGFQINEPQPRQTIIYCPMPGNTRLSERSEAPVALERFFCYFLLGLTSQWPVNFFLNHCLIGDNDSASTSNELAASHEPITRTPIFCHGLFWK